MMKKLMALLLALMMPVAALAETCSLEFTVEMNVENAAEVFKASGLFAGASDEADMCTAFAEMMDGIALRVVTQEDATRVSLAFDETNLLDLSVLTGGEDVVLLSDLMPGKGLSIPAAAFTAEDDEFLRLMASTDWMNLLSGMLASAMQQMDGVEVTSQRGSFSGDAYTGGVSCTTCTFDDAAIAAMLSGLVTDDVRALVMDMAAYWGFDGEAFLRSIEEANAAATQENAHRYILRFVYDGSDQLIGLSAVVMRGYEQLGTLSVGIGEDTLRIVAGFGLDDVNYWHCQEITVSVTEGEDGMTTIALKGGIEEFTGAKDEDFAYAAAVHETSLYEQAWTAEVNLQNGNATWRYSSTQRIEDGAVAGMTGQGMYLNGKRMTNSCTYSQDGKDYMTERLVWASCEALDITAEGVTLIALPGDDAALTDLAMEIGNELATRLMQVIPMKLLLFLQ